MNAEKLVKFGPYLLRYLIWFLFSIRLRRSVLCLLYVICIYWYVGVCSFQVQLPRNFLKNQSYQFKSFQKYGMVLDILVALGEVTEINFG